MKTVAAASRNPARGRSLGRLAWLGVGLAAVFAAATSAWGLTTVTTLGGGHEDVYGRPNGWVDGNTLESAMFNAPMGPALGPDGNLWLADRDNGAVRKLLLASGQTRTVLTNLNLPVGLVFDRDSFFYVLTAGDGTIRKYDTNLNVLATITTALTAPTALAMDGSKNLYVSQVNGLVVRVTPAGVITTIGTGLNNPGGLTVTIDGFIAVSDSGNHAVKVFDPAVAPSTGSVLTGNHGPGLINGPATLAKFNNPWGISQAPNGQFVVVDRGNHLVRLVQTNGYASILYSVPTNNWVSSIEAGAGLGFGGLNIWPGWADGPYDPTDPLALYPASMDPVSILVTPAGDVYATEWGYHIVRKVTGVDFTATGGGGSGGSGTNGVVVLNPTISPNSGYFPNGQMIRVGSPNPDVFYTTDGTEPTTNSQRVTISGNAGFLWWNNTKSDLTQLRVKAFVGTNFSATVSGQPAAANNISVPPSVRTNYYAEPGSTIYVPVVVNLMPGAQMKSLLFLVDVQASAGAPSVPAGLSLVSVSTNDFIPLVGLQHATLTFTSYGVPGTLGGKRSLLVNTIGTNFGETFTSFGVVSLLAVPIPAAAPVNATYTISIPVVTATSDGGQTDLTMDPGTSATIVVGMSGSDIGVTTDARGGLRGVTLPAGSVGYLVGDSSTGVPGGWFNAGEFGDGNLSGADVNNVFSASVGLLVPPTKSDVFGAMDAWPVDIGGTWGGDEEIRFLDVQTIIQRTMRLDGNNYVRVRLANGAKTVLGPLGTLSGSPDSPVSPITALPGAVWVKQAQLMAGIITNAQPGQSVSVPVTLSLDDSNAVSGLSFGAVVRPQGIEAAVTDAVFVPASGRPVSSVPAGVMVPPGTLVCNWDQLPTALRGRGNLLGYINFTVPTNALAGQCYVVRFLAGSGGDMTDADPAKWREPKFEIIAGRVYVRSAAPSLPVRIPDDWRIKFFGTADDLAGEWDADPDGDGVPNWKEYLAGTDPSKADSALKLRPHQTVGAMALNWLSAPAKSYVIEYSEDLRSSTWTTVRTVVGDGNYQEITVPHNPLKPRFYRVRLAP